MIRQGFLRWLQLTHLGIALWHTACANALFDAERRRREDK